MWLILPIVLQSSFVIPLQHFGRTPHKWQMCFHGNRPVMPLLACQMKSTSAREEPAGDLTDHTSVQQCDFWKPSFYWTACECWLGRRMHRTSFWSFVLNYVSHPSFVSVYSCYGLSFTKAPHMSVYDSWNTAALRGQKKFLYPVVPCLEWRSERSGMTRLWRR